MKYLSILALATFSQGAEFRPLFNGTDLTGWTGEGYVVEDGAITCTPQGKVLYTTETFSDYTLEFEFLLTPAANNGLGIHYPGKGDGAFSGMELQIIDNTAEKWKDLKDYQYHGSLYTLAPAKKEGLKPAGEWNSQTVTVMGPKVTVVLNGVTILEADLDALEKSHPDHQGVKRRAGSIAFLGHGDKVSFRNIRIAETAPEAKELEGFEPLFDGKTLSGWKYESGEKDNWFAANGILHHTGEAGPTKDLWTEEEFGDFTLALDWRWSGHGKTKAQPVVLPDGSDKLDADGKKELVEIEELDSGIYLRGNTKSQVNFWNWTVGSGEVYGYRKDAKQSAEVKAAVTPKRKADKPLGEWNSALVTVKGQLLTVAINGEVVIENALLNEMPEKGPIGLQHHGQAIDFANIRVKRD